jgi:sugar transferase (PEP-CTERM system associated)
MALLALAVAQSLLGGRAAGALLVVVCCEIFFHVNNLDKSIVDARFTDLCIDVTESILMGVAAAAMVCYWFPRLTPHAGIGATAVAVTALMPLLVQALLKQMVLRRRFVDGILIAGAGDLAGKLYRALANRNNEHDRTANGVLAFADSLAERGTTVDAFEFNQMISRNRISRVIVAEQDPLNRATLADALLAPRLRGLQVHDAVDFYEQVTGKIWVEGISSQWFVYTSGFKCSEAGNQLERILDVTLALAMLALGGPVMVLVAIAVKLSSSGPVLFRQLRVGLDGQTFDIYKFRSMRVDAEVATGPVWTGESDDRVTPVGRLLRKYRLDELPQAFNVLRGEMSIVGPRPERPCFVERLSQQIPFYNLRHYAKPGITGWAQVMYPYGASIEDAREKLQYDLYYVKHKSLGSNARILLKTVKIVLFGRGR